MKVLRELVQHSFKWCWLRLAHPPNIVLLHLEGVVTMIISSENHFSAILSIWSRGTQEFFRRRCESNHLHTSQTSGGHRQMYSILDSSSGRLSARFAMLLARSVKSRKVTILFLLGTKLALSTMYYSCKLLLLGSSLRHIVISWWRIAIFIAHIFFVHEHARTSCCWWHWQWLTNQPITGNPNVRVPHQVERTSAYPWFGDDTDSRCATNLWSTSWSLNSLLWNASRCRHCTWYATKTRQEHL